MSEARRSLLSISIALVGLALTATIAELSSLTPISVNTSVDSKSNDGFCSLREAVIAANSNSPSGSKSGECPAGSGADWIEIPAGTYVLTRTDSGKEDSSSTGDLDIKGSVRIAARPGERVVIGANAFTDRIFHVLSGTANLEGLTIQGGRPVLDGGAILNLATLTVLNSTLSGNSTGGSGGGISNRGTLTLANVTIRSNQAKNHGGGLANFAGTATLNNVTITANTADSDNRLGGDGGGVSWTGGTLKIGNTIIGGNFDNSSATKRPDCSGTLTSNGYNLIQQATTCTIAGATLGNLLGIDPLLAGLSDNGGTTFTHALLSASPAINAGSPAIPGSGGGACEPTDQRGLARPSGLRCDIGAFEFEAPDPPNPPVLIRASGTALDGLLVGSPETTFTVDFFASQTCDSLLSEATPLGSAVVVTGDNGEIYIASTLNPAVADGAFVIATATDAFGQVSAPSACIVAGPGNDSWPNALRSSLGSGSTSIDQFIDIEGQSRWYVFEVEPDSQLTITLTNLPANYDLTLYNDIQAAYGALVLETEQDLLQLGAQLAQDAFAPSAFSPDALSPSAFSPSAFSPSAFSPSAFSPSAFSPSAFSPSAFSPDALSPSAFSPSAFSPSAFSPSAFSPSAFSPSAFSPSAFSSAQTVSLIGVSAFDGPASEGLLLNTWNNDGDFYVRVRGRNGAFDPNSPFHLQISLEPGSCGEVQPVGPSTTLTGQSGGFRTLILTDLTRMGESSDALDALSASLASLAARPEVAGAVIDVGGDAKVAAANSQADGHPECPFAKNLVAEAISDVIAGYRSLNPVDYIVLVGNDEVIPFFRHPDGALLGHETNYFPPVRDVTASQASLRLGYVLSQDAYGASQELLIQDHTLPIADLPVGRLVETAADIVGLIDAYLGTPDGVLSPTTPALVTGYDFLTDAALEVERNLREGTGLEPEDLIQPYGDSPQDSTAWTAEQLRAALLGSRHDLIFLAGHFSANSALAADYATHLLTTDLDAASPGQFTNTIVFSAGCHSGYNIVDPHGIPGVTFEPDWAQALAQKGATIIAGTGYQYGDTDFIEYSERLYVEFSRQLRMGTGPVSIGEALVRAKQIYLAGTPQLRGIHEKAYLEATMFGLPMLSVDMPGSRLTDSGVDSVVPSTSAVVGDPGAWLGLRFADLNLPSTPPFPLVRHEITVTDPETGDTQTAEYLSGSNGVLANPSEPVLPLEIRNVAVPGTVLRGVGFRGGEYADSANVLPLTAAPATEIRGVHTPFVSSVFYPVRPWSLNYFDALSGGDATYLAITPAQVQSTAPGSDFVTLRKFANIQFRLFYSDYLTVTDQSVPAGADAPTIASVRGVANPDGSVRFEIRVTANPAAGVQSVWVTYTSLTGQFFNVWQSLDLTQSSTDSTLWTGVLVPFGGPATDLRFLVQAVNGVGMVSAATNQGAFYVPSAAGEPTVPTELVFTVAPTSGAYSSRATYAAQLTSGVTPLEGQLVTFGVGPVVRQALTNANGVASASLPLLAPPGSYSARATFAGTDQLIASFATGQLTITPQPTTLSLEPGAITGRPSGSFEATATLEDVSGVELGEKTIVFVVAQGAVPIHASAAITDYAGRASFAGGPFPAGEYTLTAYFGGTLNLPGGFSATFTDPRYEPSSASASLTIINNPPDCSTVVPDAVSLWPPNGDMVPVTLSGASDPDGDPVSLVTTAVRQDEPVGGDPDAAILGPDTVELRSERNGNGDGRVYHIFFTVTDPSGATCAGEVRVATVPHDQASEANIDDIDQGALFDSIVPG